MRFVKKNGGGVSLTPPPARNRVKLTAVQLHIYFDFSLYGNNTIMNQFISPQHYFDFHSFLMKLLKPLRLLNNDVEITGIKNVNEKLSFRKTIGAIYLQFFYFSQL